MVKDHSKNCFNRYIQCHKVIACNVHFSPHTIYFYLDILYRLYFIGNGVTVIGDLFRN